MVHLPLIEQFDDIAEYYSTAFHELTHSTGHKNRLDRLNETAYFGTTDYAKEELVAEIGASGMVNMLGMENKASFKNNVAYIQSWIKALKNDNRLIVSASGKAEKAIAYIMNEQPAEDGKNEEQPKEDKPKRAKTTKSKTSKTKTTKTTKTKKTA